MTKIVYNEITIHKLKMFGSVNTPLRRETITTEKLGFFRDQFFFPQHL